MSNKFWDRYTFFFAFIFPLFFSYMGEWIWPAWSATLSLVVGFLGWILLIVVLLWYFRKRPNKLYKEALQLKRNGKLVEGTIVKVLNKRKLENGYEDVEIRVEFVNFSGTPVMVDIDLVDSKPELKRNEVGKKVKLRLNPNPNSQLPWILDAGEVVKNESNMPYWWLQIFVPIYMVTTFVANHVYWSEGIGWRWVTLFHPWVLTPFWALYLGYTRAKLGVQLGGLTQSETHYEHLLYGMEATAKVLSANQTGKFINEQPEMRIRLTYHDANGEEHFVDMTKVVLLTELSQLTNEEHSIMYLPSDPQKVLFT